MDSVTAQGSGEHLDPPESILRDTMINSAERLSWRLKAGRRTSARSPPHRVWNGRPQSCHAPPGPPWQRLYFLPEPHGHGALRDGPLLATAWPGEGLRAPPDGTGG